MLKPHSGPHVKIGGQTQFSADQVPLNPKGIVRIEYATLPISTLGHPYADTHSMRANADRPDGHPRARQTQQFCAAERHDVCRHAGAERRDRSLGRRTRRCGLPHRGAQDRLERQAGAVGAWVRGNRQCADSAESTDPPPLDRERLCVGGVELQQKLLRRARGPGGHQCLDAGVQQYLCGQWPHPRHSISHLPDRLLDGRAHCSSGNRGGSVRDCAEQGALRRRHAHVRCFG